MRRRSVWLHAATSVDARQGHVATRLVDVGARVPATAFLQQPHSVPGEVRGAKAVGLGDAPAQCVVLVAEDLALWQAVFARQIVVEVFAAHGLRRMGVGDPSNAN